MSTRLRLVVEQISPVRGDPDANRSRMQRSLDELAVDRPAGAEIDAGGATLVAFPELALTGYGLGSRTAELAVPPDAPPPVRTGPGHVAILGFPERGPDQRIHNAAGAVAGDRWVHRYRKCFLPTYGSFDEGRFFAPSREGPGVFDVAGWSVATLVCEDLWHPSLTYLAALQGADVVVALSAAPGRNPTRAGGFASMDTWVRMASALATFHQLWIVVANRAGVEGGLTFAGSSFAVGPDGAMLGRLGPEADARLEVELDRGELLRARARFSHLRDEDGTLLHRELGRLLNPVT